MRNHVILSVLCAVSGTVGVGFANSAWAQQKSTVSLSVGSGQDFGAAVMAAYDQVAAGGTIDGSDITSPQTMTTSIILRKPVRLLLPCVTIKVNDAQLVVSSPSGVLEGAEIKGCGKATNFIVSGVTAKSNRFMRVLGNYAPALLKPPVGPVGQASVEAGTNRLSDVSDVRPSSGPTGLLEELRSGDSIVVVGGSRFSTRGLVTPIMGVSDGTITTAYPLPEGAGTRTLVHSIGGYRVPSTTGTATAGSAEVQVSDGSAFFKGDSVRVTSAGPGGQDLFARVVGTNAARLQLDKPAATSTPVVVMYVVAAGQRGISAASPDEAKTVAPGDWVQVGEWMNFGDSNSDWNRVEWQRVKAVNGRIIEFEQPLRRSIGLPSIALPAGFPVYWRKMSGLIVGIHVHQFQITSTDSQLAAAMDVQNGEGLQLDNLGINIQKGTCVELVNQLRPSLHDNMFSAADFPADLGGTLDGVIENNTLTNVGKGPVMLLELGTAYNILRGNRLLGADSQSPNEYRAALGGAAVDFNTFDSNVATASGNVSCYSILGGEGNRFLNNQCDGGMTGISIQEWRGIYPARAAIKNVVSGNTIRNSKVAVRLIDTLGSNHDGTWNSVRQNRIDGAKQQQYDFKNARLLDSDAK